MSPRELAAAARGLFGEALGEPQRAVLHDLMALYPDETPQQEGGRHG